MPRITNPGDISTGPGKAVSTDPDVLVLNSYAGGSGAGAYIPPGETTPRDGYPALPCRACGGAGTSGSAVAGSVEETILTVGLPNANAAWTGFTPDYTTLADAVDAADTLMNDDGGLPGRAVRILVVGPTVETAVPIQIPADGLVIEGYPHLDGVDGAITWATNDPLIDLNGHDDLIFRDLYFKWNGSVPPPGPGVPLRLLFTSTSPSTMSRVVIDNCRCDGEIQGFYGPDFVGSTGGFEGSSFTRNYAREILEFGIVATSFLAPPFQGCVIRDNFFEAPNPTTFSFPCIGMAAFGPASNSTTIRGNLLNGFGYGVSTFGAPSTTGTTIITENIIGNTEQEGIYVEGNANQVTGNSLFRVYTNGAGTGIYVNGDSNVVDKNFVILDSTGTAIEIDTAGENNVCTENDVISDLDGEIVVRAAISVVTKNKAKSVRATGGNSTVSLNLVSPGAVTGLTVNGNESTVMGNNVATNVQLAGAGCTVVGNQITGGLATLGSATRCTFGDNHISDNMVIGADSVRHTIEGNVVEGDLLVNSSNQAITGNIIRGLSGMILNVAASACTITGNKVLNDLQSGGDNCTISGNRVNNNIAVNGNEQMVTGNWVFNNLVVGGTDCTVESNKADLLVLNGTRATVGDNKVEGLVGNVPACTVSGNWVLATLTMNAGAQYCTIGDNAAEWFVLNGPDCTIGDNVIGQTMQVGGTDCSIVGNKGGGGSPGDLFVAGIGCTLNGNNIVGAIDVQGTDCVITGNKCDVLVNSAAPVPPGAPPPLRTVITGNRYMDTNVIVPAGAPEFGFVANGSPAASTIGNF